MCVYVFHAVFVPLLCCKALRTMLLINMGGSLHVLAVDWDFLVWFLCFLRLGFFYCFCYYFYFVFSFFVYSLHEKNWKMKNEKRRECWPITDEGGLGKRRLSVHQLLLLFLLCRGACRYTSILISILIFLYILAPLYCHTLTHLAILT